MKKLLKEYGFNSDMQYFEMIVESYLNGQVSQAQQQFKKLPKAEKQGFIRSSLLYWKNGMTSEQVLNVFLPLL